MSDAVNLDAQPGLELNDVDEVPRPTSAPPHLENNFNGSILDFPPAGFGGGLGFDDFRRDLEYRRFYENYATTTNYNKLPKPLGDPLFLTSEARGGGFSEGRSSHSGVNESSSEVRDGRGGGPERGEKGGVDDNNLTYLNPSAQMDEYDLYMAINSAGTHPQYPHHQHHSPHHPHHPISPDPLDQFDQGYQIGVAGHPNQFAMNTAQLQLLQHNSSHSPYSAHLPYLTRGGLVQHQPHSGPPRDARLESGDCGRSPLSVHSSQTALPLSYGQLALPADPPHSAQSPHSSQSTDHQFVQSAVSQMNGVDHQEYLRGNNFTDGDATHLALTHHSETTTSLSDHHASMGGIDTTHHQTHSSHPGDHNTKTEVSHLSHLTQHPHLNFPSWDIPPHSPVSWVPSSLDMTQLNLPNLPNSPHSHNQSHSTHGYNQPHSIFHRQINQTHSPRSTTDSLTSSHSASLGTRVQSGRLGQGGKPGGGGVLGHSPHSGGGYGTGVSHLDQRKDVDVDKKNGMQQKGNAAHIIAGNNPLPSITSSHGVTKLTSHNQAAIICSHMSQQGQGQRLSISSGSPQRVNNNNDVMSNCGTQPRQKSHLTQVTGQRQQGQHCVVTGATHLTQQTNQVNGPGRPQNRKNVPLCPTAQQGTPQNQTGGHKPASIVPLPVEELVTQNIYQGNVYNISKDQAGCRALQQKLHERSPEHVEAIFNECLSHITDLMSDPFGNYLCQKIMEVSDPTQLGAIVDKVGASLVKVSLNMHGTRAVQKMIEKLSIPAQIECVVRSLKPAVVTLVKDLNGNHVIQKCLTSLSSQHNDFIYQAISSSCVDVATHRHGCCVLQRCIDSASPYQRALVIGEITNHSLTLVQDAFGNYVVQYVLNLKDEEANDRIVDTLLSDLTELSKQKFASNVVERCLMLGSQTSQSKMIDELLAGGVSQLKELLLDSFANYVIQKALSVATDPQLAQLLAAIRPATDELRTTPSGKRIASKLMKKYPSLGPCGGASRQCLNRNMGSHDNDIQTPTSLTTLASLTSLNSPLKNACAHTPSSVNSVGVEFPQQLNTHLPHMAMNGDHSPLSPHAALAATQREGAQAAQEGSGTDSESPHSLGTACDDGEASPGQNGHRRSGESGQSSQSGESGIGAQMIQSVRAG
eukprot:GHVN01089087.1.p1 GENE.GHVN01089087.1~~GHVN01089087.1.p1  ORF type:complete len:1142 (+),score=297.12 GHVN01089087.1:294-3719(+)